MIGLSVSSCVAAIVKGEMDIENVEKIIGGTRCTDEKDWDNVIESYRRGYWHKFPEEAEKIIRQLLSEGKIEQPRLKDSPEYPIYKRHEFWVETEDQVNLIKCDA